MTRTASLLATVFLLGACTTAGTQPATGPVTPDECETNIPNRPAPATCASS